MEALGRAPRLVAGRRDNIKITHPEDLRLAELILAGDAVLRTLAAGVMHAIRREDIFARYGGEEFALLSRGIDMEGGRQFAERIREWIANYPFEHEGTFLPVTASIGENDCGPENGGFNVSDFNEDCLVNLVDFATFGLQWMECSIGSCN